MTRARPLTPDRFARRKVAWIGHAIIYVMGCLTVFIASSSVFVLGLVAAGWGLGLACHGYFALAAPILRVRFAEGAAGDRALTASSGQDHARFVQELAASIAHEIRNPITAARSLVQQIGEDPAGSDNAEYARVAAAELDRVERSISHLLKYSREPAISPARIGIGDVVASALETLRDRIGSLGVDVDTDIAADAHAWTDGEKIRQVIVNLCANALDALEHSPVPAPRVHVSAGRDLAGATAWVRVKDNGAGIPTDILPRVFQPFYTSRDTGTGLGLAISRRLAQAHGGDLEVTSQPGAGAEFVLTLPAERGAP